MTRKIGETEKASTMAFYIQLNFVAVSSLMGLIFGDGHLADPSQPIQFLSISGLDSSILAETCMIMYWDRSHLVDWQPTSSARLTESQKQE